MFDLPKLSYSLSALDNVISKKIMDLHANKHHLGYAKKLNDAVSKYSEYNKETIEELLANLTTLPDSIQKSIRNNGGGYYNHNLFFDLMTPGGAKMPLGKLDIAINETFGSYDDFKKAFTEKALTLFGSGWVFLVEDKDGNLFISRYSNQDNPLMGCCTKQGNPIIGLDVWEHAYYLDYQNRRGEYVEKWFDLINWDKAEKNYNK